jgi:hypothetical protein
MVDAQTADTLKAINTFVGKSDGRDKLCATVQYACMFIAAGQPGDARKIMASVAAARKVFRIMRPLENVTPLLIQPKFLESQPLHTQALNKLKALLNALYFGADHVVWASQAGLTTNKALVDRAQKVSLYSWLGASCCTIASELTEILRAALPAILVQEPEEEDAVYLRRQQAAVDEINKRGLTLFHASVQALLAVGLLQLRPWKPRAVGALGVVASAINCYMLFPSLPKPAKRVEGSLDKMGEPTLKGASPAKLPPASPQPKIAAAKMA